MKLIESRRNEMQRQKKIKYLLSKINAKKRLKLKKLKSKQSHTLEEAKGNKSILAEVKHNIGK